MNRIIVSREARLSLQAARKSIEKAIKEAKTVTRASRRPDWTVAPSQSAFSEAQAQLVVLKRQATLIYTALAARRGKLHSKVSEGRLDALRRKFSSEVMLKYRSETEKLVMSLFEAPAPASAAPAASASVAA